MNAISLWGGISALFITMSLWQYMWGIYRRKVPCPIISTWGMWSMLGFLLLVASYKTGARMDTTLPAVWMGFINPTLILLISLRYGELKWTQLDTWCLAVFLLAIVSWQLFGDPMAGLFLALLADLVSVVPQMRKNWEEPNEEIWYPWTLFSVGSAINLLAIEEWKVAYWAYPLYMTLMSMCIAAPVVLHRLGLYKKTSLATH